MIIYWIILTVTGGEFYFTEYKIHRRWNSPL